MAKQIILAFMVDMVNHAPEMVKLVPGMDAESINFASLVKESSKAHRVSERPQYLLQGDPFSKWHSAELVKKWAKDPEIWKSLSATFVQPAINFITEKFPASKKQENPIGSNVEKLLSSRAVHKDQSIS